MSAMSQELGHDNLSWDDQSWAFPNLVGEQDCVKKLAAAAKDDDQEEAPPPKEKKKTTRKQVPVEKGGVGCGESDDHELHIWTERERRKKMRNMFANLHSLLPHLPSKADKSSIVDEAVNYIKKLQVTLESLEKQKLERLYGMMTHYPMSYDPSMVTQQRLTIQSREAFLAEQGSTNNSAVTLASPEFPAIFKTWTSPNVILSISGKDAHISVCSVKKPGLLTAVCFVMEKHKLDVVSADISSDRNTCMYMIHARANGGLEQFQQAFPVEEIYKQAAAEIMLWVNS